MKDGIILINKEKGMTSRSVDNQIQRLFHIKKVGHLGTLDPFATGLLIVAINKGCKALPYLYDEDKTYIAELFLGIKTNSGDLTSEVVEKKDIPSISKEEINKVFESFLGESKQIPPMTSAIHINGKRLYDLAHSNIEVERKPRSIHIHSLKLLEFKDSIIKFEVKCSKGTYVRTLGEDIAVKLNTVGHLISLSRIKIGDIFTLNEAKEIKDIKEENVLDVCKGIQYPHILLEDEQLIKDVYQGKQIVLNSLEKTVLLTYRLDNEEKALAVYNLIKEGIYAPIRGLW
ncbi:MAG: tRNA pseudouridine(55) synthase TruB [Bacilli bacterium]|nr:tRNA pseudouridine(55) synthase TruB [Bacilli bacterium]